MFDLSDKDALFNRLLAEAFRRGGSEAPEAEAAALRASVRADTVAKSASGDVGAVGEPVTATSPAKGTEGDVAVSSAKLQRRTKRVCRGSTIRVRAPSAPTSKQGKFLARCVELGVKPPPSVPRRVWGLLVMLERARREETVRRVLRELGPDVARAVELVALGPNPETGETHRTLLAARPMAIVRCAVASCKLSRRVGRRRLVSGISRKLWCVLAGRSPQTGRDYSVSAVCNRRHRRDGAAWRGDCGFLPALEQAGVFSRYQPPGDSGALTGPSGYAYAQHAHALRGLLEVAPRAGAPPPS